MSDELLRLSTSRIEIEKKLDEAIFMSAEVKIWQNHDEKRTYFRGVFVRRLPHTNVIVLKSQGHERFDFEQEAKLFLQTAHESILFKTKIDFASPTTLFLSFPTELHLKELRLHPRKNVSSQEIPVEFTVKGRQEKRLAKLIDVSAGGCALLVHESNKVEREASILIYNFGNLTFEPPREMVVKYVRDTERSSVKNYRVGGSFKIQLPESVMGKI